MFSRYITIECHVILTEKLPSIIHGKLIVICSKDLHGEEEKRSQVDEQKSWKFIFGIASVFFEWFGIWGWFLENFDFLRFFDFFEIFYFFELFIYSRVLFRGQKSRNKEKSETMLFIVSITFQHVWRRSLNVKQPMFGNKLFLVSILLHTGPESSRRRQPWVA